MQNLAAEFKRERCKFMLRLVYRNDALSAIGDSKQAALATLIRISFKNENRISFYIFAAFL